MLPLELEKGRQLAQYMSDACSCDIESCEDVILVTAYYAECITVEEIYVLFHDIVHYDYDNVRLHKVFTKLKDDGLLDIAKLPHRDQLSRCVYALTKQGHAAISTMILKPRAFNDVLRSVKKDGISIQHTYSCGLSFIHALCSQEPFSFDHETTFKDGRVTAKNTKSGGSVTSDAILHIKDKKTRQFVRHYYVEQDMGTESNIELVQKIYGYISNGVIGDSNLSSIVFLFRKPYLIPDEPCFNLKKVKTLCADFEKSGAGTLSGLTHCTDGAVLSSLLGVLPESRDFDVEDLKNYYAELERKDYERYQYVSAACLQKQAVFARKRRQNLTEIFMSKVVAGKTNKAIDLFLSGAHVYAFATDMFKYYLRHICTAERLKKFTDSLAFSVSRYFPGLEPDSYSPLFTCKGTKTHTPPVSYANSYAYSGGHVCFEFPFADIGAYIRMAYGCNYIIPDSDSLIVCMVVENELEAHFISDYLHYLGSFERLPRGRLFFTFLNLSAKELYVCSSTKDVCFLKAE